MKKTQASTPCCGSTTSQNTPPGCGFLCFKPKWLQRFVKVPHFVGIVSLFTVSFVMLQLYLVAVITTLEKRFGFSSSSSGMLISIREIAYLCSVIVASHFAKNTHKPKYLAALGYIAVVGGFISFLPYIIYRDWSGSDNELFSAASDISSQDLCLPENSNHLRVNDNSSLEENEVQTCGVGAGGTFNRPAYALFAISCVIMGLTYSSVSPLTITYVDDAASETHKGLYLGIMNAMKPFGPLLAFLLGGVFTNLPEDLYWPDVTSGDNTQWVGAWWLGYITCPALLLLSSILLAFFPKQLPKEAEDDVTVCDALHDVNEIPDEKSKYSSPSVSHKLDSRDEVLQSRPNAFHEMLLSLSRLVRHPVYMMLLGGACFSAFVVAGMLPFIPKYLEVQFRLTAAMANVLTGVLGAMMAGFGILLGGLVVSRMRLTVSQCALFVLLTDIGFVVTILSMGAVGCQQSTFVDPNNRFPELSIESSCTPHCACSSTLYQPVCGSDMRTYISPCHAGCVNMHRNQTFSSCECIGGGGTAVSGTCETQCTSVIPYMALCACAALIGMMAGVPALTILLRTVDEEDRSIAMGLSGTVVGLTSFVPGPILFGGLIDSTCLLWHTSCGQSGACVLYNNSHFRIQFHVTTAGAKAIAACFYVVLWLILRKQSKTEQTNNEQQQDNIENSDTTHYHRSKYKDDNCDKQNYLLDKETTI